MGLGLSMELQDPRELTRPALIIYVDKLHEFIERMKIATKII